MSRVEGPSVDYKMARGQISQLSESDIKIIMLRRAMVMLGLFVILGAMCLVTGYGNDKWETNLKMFELCMAGGIICAAGQAREALSTFHWRRDIARAALNGKGVELGRL